MKSAASTVQQRCWKQWESTSNRGPSSGRVFGLAPFFVQGTARAGAPGYKAQGARALRGADARRKNI